MVTVLHILHWHKVINLGSFLPYLMRSDRRHFKYGGFNKKQENKKAFNGIWFVSTNEDPYTTCKSCPCLDFDLEEVLSPIYPHLRYEGKQGNSLSKKIQMENRALKTKPYIYL